MSGIERKIGKLFDESLLRYAHTQAEIARQSGISKRQVNQFCTGELTNPKFTTFVAMIEALPKDSKQYFFEQLFVIFELRNDDSQLSWLSELINITLSKYGEKSFNSNNIYSLANLLLKVDIAVALQLCLDLQTYLLNRRGVDLAESKFPENSNN